MGEKLLEWNYKIATTTFRTCFKNGGIVAAQSSWPHKKVSVLRYISMITPKNNKISSKRTPNLKLNYVSLPMIMTNSSRDLTLKSLNSTRHLHISHNAPYLPPHTFA